MEIDNIKNYISDTNHNSFMEIANELYELTSWLNKTYPGYKEWFYNKQIKGCLTPNRNIIFVKNKKGKIIALSCLKKDEKERKICTLFVSDKYRKHGIGSLLLEESMRFLETTKPLITFTEDKLPMFKGMIAKYNYEMLMNEKYILNKTSFSITDLSGNDIPLTSEKTFAKSRVLTKDTNK